MAAPVVARVAVLGPQAATASVAPHRINMDSFRIGLSFPGINTRDQTARRGDWFRLPGRSARASLREKPLVVRGQCRMNAKARKRAFAAFLLCPNTCRRLITPHNAVRSTPRHRWRNRFLPEHFATVRSLCIRCVHAVYTRCTGCAASNPAIAGSRRSASPSVVHSNARCCCRNCFLLSRKRQSGGGYIPARPRPCAGHPRTSPRRSAHAASPPAGRRYVPPRRDHG